MNKKALVNEILDLYDTIDNYKNELKKYKAPTQILNIINVEEENNKENEFKKLDSMAKKMLFDKMMSSWNLRDLKVEVEEDSGEFNFLTFEQFYKTIDMSRVINSGYNYLFENLTHNELKEYFKNEFMEYYKKQVDNKKMEIVRSSKNEEN